MPATLEFLDDKCIGAVEDYAKIGPAARRGRTAAVRRRRGTGAQWTRNLARIGDLCTASGAIEVALAESPERSEALLTARRCHAARAVAAGFHDDPGGRDVPRPRLAEMVDRINEIAARHDVPIATFGHAGDGNLHPTCVVDQHDDGRGNRPRAEAFADIFTAAIELGGTITGEHGVGAAKLPYLAARLGDDQMALLRRIKQAFDPAGILNPGKLVP